jgi:sugar/nucleoside kinase (ribokinase family)
MILTSRRAGGIFTVELQQKPIAVVGDAFLDIDCVPAEPWLPSGQIMAKTAISVGGTAANVAISAATSGSSVQLWAPGADDDAGMILARHTNSSRVEWRRSIATKTGVVINVMTSQGLLFAVDVAEPRNRTSEIAGLNARTIRWLHLTGHWLFDTVESLDELSPLLRFCRKDDVSISIDLGNHARVQRLGVAAIHRIVSIVSPTYIICSRKESDPIELDSWAGDFTPYLIITDARRPVTVVNGRQARQQPISEPIEAARHVKGAGDAFLGSLIAHLWRGQLLDKALLSAISSARERVIGAGNYAQTS